MRFSCLAIGTFAVLSACNGGGTSSAPNDWRQAVRSVTHDGIALYSFRFTSESATGALPHFSLQLDPSGEACARYTGVGSGIEDYWFLDIMLSSTSSGGYAVSLEDAAGAKTMVANVALLHRVNGTYAANFPATHGTVILPSALPVESARARLPAAIQLEVDFPEHAMQNVECRGGQAASGGPIMESCTCRDEVGAESTCVPQADTPNCCIDPSSGSVHFARNVSATACAGMCRQVVGLSVDYCAGLQ